MYLCNPNLYQDTEGCHYTQWLLKLLYFPSHISHIGQEKEIKGIQIGRKEEKLWLFTDDILYIENLEVPTKRLLEVINEFSKGAGYKINIQKSVAFLYTNTELSGREVEETIPFTFTSERMKYLGINLTKNMKNLYSENYKSLMKEFENYTKKWKDIPCSWIGRVNIFKLSILPKAI